MKRILRNSVLLAVVALTAACPRRVEVESEPNQPRYLQAASVAPVDVVGTYDYEVMLEDGAVTGPMTVTRADGAYAVRFVLDDGTVLPTRNVVRDGDTMSMDVSTPGGEGTVALEWQDANTVTGRVFLGEYLEFRATRRP